MKSASIKDIANSLSVSKTLVSLVLNKKGSKYGISIQTQEKVLEKAKELNYKPNRLAQGLRLGKSKNIGLIVPDISNPFYSKISRFIGDCVGKQGYNLMIYNTDEDVQKEKKIIQTLLETHVEGIILTSTSIKIEDIKYLKNRNIPFVLVDRVLEGINTNYVGINNYQGAVEAVEYLIDKNSKNIAFLSVGPLYISSLEARRKGFIDTLKNKKLNYNKDFDISVSYHNLEEDLKEKLNFLFVKSEQKPDAIFIANNKLAIESLKIFKALKISIPNDLLVVSFDDIPLFDILPFPVCTIAQPIQDICETASKILFDEINAGQKWSESEMRNIVLDPKLIRR